MNLSIKVKNIIGRGGFAARMSMFNKKSENNSSKNIVTTGSGTSIKDRLNFLNIIIKFVIKSYYLN